MYHFQLEAAFRIPLNVFLPQFDVPLAASGAQIERKERRKFVLPSFCRSFAKLLGLNKSEGTHNNGPSSHNVLRVFILLIAPNSRSRTREVNHSTRNTNEIWWFINSFRVRYEKVIACYFFVLRFFFIPFLQLFSNSSLLADVLRSPVAPRNVLWFDFLPSRDCLRELYAITEF